MTVAAMNDAGVDGEHSVPYWEGPISISGSPQPGAAISR
ncbi:MAG: lipocalin family protein [Rhodopseudomonas palustris]|nr:lipocalin family protein [Rhodopseudomonas palustris]